MPELTTDRLIVDEFTSDDAAFMLRLLNDPDFIRNVADRGVRSLEQARQYLRDGPLASYREHGFGLFAVRRREDRQTIGTCGLIRRPGLEEVDIGYSFLPEARGQGLAIEAARAVWQYATGPLALPRIVAIVTPGNLASRRLLEKLGMRYERDIRLTADAELLCFYGWTAKSGNAGPLPHCDRPRAPRP